MASPVYTLCPGGNGDIEIVAKNGTKPYIYYVVPESQWEHGDQVYQHLRNGNKTILNKYTFSNYVVQRPPGIYWVAVQDANDCVPISGSYMMASWKTVEVIDNLEPIEVTDGEDMKLMTTCFGQDDGRINSLSLAVPRMKRDTMFLSTAFMLGKGWYMTAMSMCFAVRFPATKKFWNRANILS